MKSSDDEFFSKMTESAALAMVIAHNEAIRFRNNRFGTEHLLLGLIPNDRSVALGWFGKVTDRLIKPKHSIAAEALASAGVTFADTFAAIKQRTGIGQERGSSVPFTDNAKAALQEAEREALAGKANYIATEHILLGILANRRSTATLTLQEMEVNLDELERDIRVKEEQSSWWLRT